MVGELFIHLFARKIKFISPKVHLDLGLNFMPLALWGLK